MLRYNRLLLFLVLLCLSLSTACAMRAEAGTQSAWSPVETVTPPPAEYIATPSELAEPTPAPTPEPTPEPVYQVKLAVTGDLMVHDKQLDSAYQKAADTYSFTSFETIAPYLRDADYTIGNLETTLSGSSTGYTGYPTFNTPDSFAEALKEAGFTFLTTANNHSNDRREKGILRTLSKLDELGFDHVGTYASQADQDQVFIKEINNIRFAFLSYTYSTNGIPVADGKPYLVNMLDEALMKRQIEQARQQGAEIIVVLPHMGNEYEEKPAQQFVTLAHNLCKWGADVVMASHPHVLQPTEVLEVQDEDGSMRTCFIAYSMGNFVSSQRTIPRDTGAVFNLHFEKAFDGENWRVRLTQAAYTPTWVQFINKKGNYDINVLPVYETLLAAEAGADTGLRPEDLKRLREVHRTTTLKMLGEEIPLEFIQPSYNLYIADDKRVILSLTKDLPAIDKGIKTEKGMLTQ